jgi:hypothetical protein
VVKSETSPILDELVATFAADWLRLSGPGVAQRLVADPILVLGPAGTVPVPKTAFLAAVTGRSDAVAAVKADTTLVGAEATALGDRMVLATISWEFALGTGRTTLVSDFLLQREPDGLRCVAYLPRTNVLDHLR